MWVFFLLQVSLRKGKQIDICCITKCTVLSNFEANYLITAPVCTPQPTSFPAFVGQIIHFSVFVFEVKHFSAFAVHATRFPILDAQATHFPALAAKVMSFPALFVDVTRQFLHLLRTPMPQSRSTWRSCPPDTCRPGQSPTFSRAFRLVSFSSRAFRLHNTLSSAVAQASRIPTFSDTLSLPYFVNLCLLCSSSWFKCLTRFLVPTVGKARSWTLSKKKPITLY